MARKDIWEKSPPVRQALPTSEADVTPWPSLLISLYGVLHLYADCAPVRSLCNYPRFWCRSLLHVPADRSILSGGGCQQTAAFTGETLQEICPISLSLCTQAHSGSAASGVRADAGSPLTRRRRLGFLELAFPEPAPALPRSGGAGQKCVLSCWARLGPTCHHWVPRKYARIFTTGNTRLDRRVQNLSTPPVLRGSSIDSGGDMVAK